MDTLGTHIIADLYGCDPHLLDDCEALRELVLATVDKSGATYLEDHFRRFSPQGVTGVVIVAESHFSFHTWPEYGYLAVDFFTCGDRVDPQAAIDLFVSELEPTVANISVHERGSLYAKHFADFSAASGSGCGDPGE